MAALPKSNTFASVTEWRIPRNTVLIEGARVHVTKLCQSTILFGIVWVLLSRYASDPVCGGTIRAAGFPVPRGMHYRAMWQRALLQGRDGPAYHCPSPHKRDVFCAMADSEFAHSCCKVKPGLDSMYFKDQSADAPKNHYLIFLNHCSEGCAGTCLNLRNCGGLGSSLTTSDGITTVRSISVILRLK